MTPEAILFAKVLVILVYVIVPLLVVYLAIRFVVVMALKKRRTKRTAGLVERTSIRME